MEKGILDRKRRLAARQLLVGPGEILHNAGVTISDSGEILEIFISSPEEAEREAIPFYEGILTPGFVNAHTHMELSFFDGVFSPGGSMVAFLRQIDSLRIDIDQKRIEDSLAAAYEVLSRDGQVAYADISNAADTAARKSKEAFESVSFVEVFGVNGELARKAWTEAQKVYQTYQDYGVKAVYTPHAPYSVSEELWQLLEPQLIDSDIFSLHFAETPQEMEFMLTGEGEMKRLFEEEWKRTTNVPSLETLKHRLERLTADGQKLLLIHCVCLDRELMDWVKAHLPTASIVLCPASNLFIEGAMPSIDLMRQAQLPLAVGTDSYSSSPTLSMLDQIKLINCRYPEIPILELLGWSTFGGSQACGFEDLGQLKPSTHPGVNLITGPALSANSLVDAKVKPIANRMGWVAVE